MIKLNEQSIIDRTIYFDYLRVAATFAVIILHVASQNWHIADVNGLDWQLFNFYDSIVRWGVPAFIMISGALFLNREIPLKIIYTKYIFRIIVAFFFWSIIYVLILEGSIKDFITGHYHMWFLFMISAIYMCIPFVKKIIVEDNLCEYFLILGFLFTFAIPGIINIAYDFGNDLIIKVADVINQNVGNMKLQMVIGYIVYFVAGYYVNKISLNKKQRLTIYLLGVLGFLLTIVLDLLIALETQTPCSKYYGDLNINIFLEALAVFTWFKYRKYNWNRLNGLIQKLSKYSFGAYLVHALILEEIDVWLGLNTLSFNVALSVISISILVFIISFSISAIVNHIPIFKKYVV